MPTVTPQRTLNIASLLAVIALLYTLGTQLIEAVHVHSDGETVSSCVHCQASGGAAIVTSLPELPAFAFCSLLCLVYISAKPLHRAILFQARGPPLRS